MKFFCAKFLGTESFHRKTTHISRIYLKNIIKIFLDSSSQKDSPKNNLHLWILFKVNYKYKFSLNTFPHKRKYNYTLLRFTNTKSFHRKITHPSNLFTEYYKNIFWKLFFLETLWISNFCWQKKGSPKNNLHLLIFGKKVNKKFFWKIFQKKTFMFDRSEGPCHKKSTIYSRNIYRIYTRSVCFSTNILKEVHALGSTDPLKMLKNSKCVLLEILLKYLRFVVNRSFKIYS